MPIRTLVQPASYPEEAPAAERLFIALWPDPATRSALAALQAALLANSGGRPVHSEQLHLTLAFLGRQPLSVLPALEALLAGLPPLDRPLILDRYGHFARQRITWAGMHAPCPALLALQQRLTDALEERGIAFARYPHFIAHVTLARKSEPPQQREFAPICWRADRIVLVQSCNADRGRSYRLLAQRDLGAASGASDDILGQTR